MASALRTPCSMSTLPYVPVMDQFDFRAAERIRNRKRIVDTGVEDRE